MWWQHSTQWENIDLRLVLADIFTTERCSWNNYYTSHKCKYGSVSMWVTLLILLKCFICFTRLNKSPEKVLWWFFFTPSHAKKMSQVIKKKNPDYYNLFCTDSHMGKKIHLIRSWVHLWLKCQMVSKKKKKTTQRNTSYHNISKPRNQQETDSVPPKRDEKLT